MANPECSSSKGVGHARVEDGIIDIAESFGQWQKVIGAHKLISKKNWQKFLVDNVLPFSIQDSARFLKKMYFINVMKCKFINNILVFSLIVIVLLSLSTQYSNLSLHWPINLQRYLDTVCH